MVDDNEFFRDATLSICGSPKIEEAMCACVRAIENFLPVDRMFLQVFEPDLGAMRTVATATAEDGENVDLLTPLAEQTRQRIRQRAAAAPEKVVVIDSEEQNPVAREMLRSDSMTSAPHPRGKPLRLHPQPTRSRSTSIRWSRAISDGSWV